MDEKKFIDKIVKVQFKDHTKNSQEITLHEVFGILTEINNNKIVIKQWNCLDDNMKNECEYIALIRSAVINIKELIECRK